MPRVDAIHLEPMSEWRHLASGRIYVVIAVGACATNGYRNGHEQSVVYWSREDRKVWYREVGEFLDGRFEPVKPVAKAG